MKVFSSLQAAAPDQDTIVTIGTFDGVHRGHQYLLGRLVEHARVLGRQSVAVSFDPHPRSVLSSQESPRILCSTEERVRLIEAIGVDTLLLLSFTLELANTSAERFAQRLSQAMAMRELWVGSDFAMGQDRAGTTKRLRDLGKKQGFCLRVLAPYRVAGETVSSTRIRQLLAEGALERANDLLGRYYAYAGEVAPGAQRGRRLGFRTANLEVSSEYALPADGVYAVWAEVHGRRYRGVANIGIRPSFDAGDRRLEVHLLDYSGDLYDDGMRVFFVKRLREERRFDSAEALIAQIQGDIERTRSILRSEARERAFDGR